MNTIEDGDELLKKIHEYLYKDIAKARYFSFESYFNINSIINITSVLCLLISTEISDKFEELSAETHDLSKDQDPI